MTQDKTPLVSVVMCSFNPPEIFFREAIQSVRQQTYPNWELWIVDNGTTNGSDAIAREYAEKFPQIHYREHPGRANKGPAASRNLGIEQSAGEYIAFLDADDLWLPEKLALQMKAMLSHPAAAFSFGGMCRWLSWEKDGQDTLEIHTQTLEILLPPELIHRFLRNESIPGMSSLMVRKTLAQEVGSFEETLLWAEDQTIVYKLGLKYESLILPGWDMKYRQHPQSTTTAVEASGHLFADHLHFLDWVRDYFKSAGIQDAALNNELKKLQNQYRRLVWKQKLIPQWLRSLLKKLKK